MMSKVKKYLEHNYMNYDLSLDTVSSLLNINASYLSSIFKRCTGINFIDYITNLRISAAKEYLADPFKTVSEIVSMVGYDSSSYFSRAFKKKYWVYPNRIPKAYRRGGWKQMKKVVFIALILILVFFACRKEESSYPELVLRYADNQSDGYPTVEAAKYLAELVKERTEGKIEIRIYPIVP